MEGTKWCHRCGIDKPRDEFTGVLRNGVRYPVSNCKPCMVILVSAHRHAEREFLAGIKDRPCADCGGRFPSYVMHFDHRDRTTKLGELSRLAGRVSRKQLLEEVAKCDVVCANCHAIRTHGPR